jgi:hypothetical protein
MFDYFILAIAALFAIAAIITTADRMPFVASLMSLTSVICVGSVAFAYAMGG